ncbi:MAG TPA: SDR family NAD(P)-dependent oxidoreductase [Anaerolinea thermolimosa]|uniref:SDR family NAD(P)-dependent oxidoreductase n=2 Tax=Anaerolinea thermolimosa TaxID=229919 RepID=A0A3D1JET2_9CHLR|nr:SDR family oxidoreductase [Anaerolinea thermolimosa]HCE16954.1 SDR family NAD(P)-dependent oxidoreductase [Anaerolinea thermolimosa]
MMKRIPSWQGKTALITGASSGIGEAAARLLSRKGLRVILTARRVDRLEALAEEIIHAGGQADVRPADLSVEEERQRLAEAVMESTGCPDVLVNNAGFGWYGYYHDMPWETAQSMIRVNIEAPAHLTRLFLPAMLARGWGCILNISSIAGNMPNQGVAVYAASKAFLDSFTTSLYRETRGSGVQVCSIRPGPVSSEFFEQALRHPNGRAVPAERFAVPPQRVAECLWSVMNHPRRVAYVPPILALSPWLERLFGGVIDLLGPLLLRREDPTRHPSFH